MEKIIVYSGVFLGLLSMPALFFAGLYLLQKKVLRSFEAPLRRWLAALGYSAAIFAAWWGVYFWGGRLPFGNPDNSLATFSMMFGYSAYALLPVSFATGAVSLVGALLSGARVSARH